MSILAEYAHRSSGIVLNHIVSVTDRAGKVSFVMEEGSGAIRRIHQRFECVCMWKYD